MLTHIPQKVFGWATLLLMLLGIAMKGHLPLQLIALAVSLFCLYCTETPERWKMPGKRQELMLMLVVLYGPILYIVYVGYQDERDTRNFRNYLTEHRCKYVGTIVTGYAPGGCDNVGRCVDGEEIEEGQYFCRATGNKLTFKQFQAGSYGH